MKKQLLFLCLLPALGWAQTTPKPATKYTEEINKKVYSELDFTDSLDFEEAQRGFIATLDSGIIRNAAGKIIVNLHEYDFLKGEAPATVNPSLWRQSKLNVFNGLFKLTDGVYQIRSLDLAVMTFIRTDKGYIVIDPLTNADAARAGHNLIRKHVGERPVLAVITTHSHADHYGGIEGVVKAEDILSGKVKYIAPVGFYEESVSEGILLGTAMGRRAGYQFGGPLPRSEYGTVDAGVGKSFSGGGVTSLLPPNISITHTGQKLDIDGIELIFQLTQNAEAPAEMHFFAPKYKTLFPADNILRSHHNILTPRGAKTRDTRAWYTYIDEAIDLFGKDVEIVAPGHNWPAYGHKNSIDYLEGQRDLYKYIHDQTIFLANRGLNMEEIAETIKLPAELGKKWFNRDYYATIQHNSKAIYQYYLGWWDGNPSNYNKLPETEAAKRYLDYMGGEVAVIAKARKSYDEGDYRWVAEVLKHVVFANPDNWEARNLQADAFEQIGYQSESSLWRNIYLTGALELRDQSPAKQSPRNTGEFLKKLNAESLIDLLSVSINGQRAAGKSSLIRLHLPEEKKNILLILKNGVLRQKSNQPDIKADLELTFTQEQLAGLFINPKETVATIFQTAKGDVAKLIELSTLIDPVNPNWNIIIP
jgi:alkyl sulfatase BDS1-like metallo-beta-lactamase superfamily hydrolase